MSKTRLSTARYGVKAKKKLEDILQMSNKKYLCEECDRLRLVRGKFKGVWRCGFCGYEKVGGAYTP